MNILSYFIHWTKVKILIYVKHQVGCLLKIYLSRNLETYKHINTGQYSPKRWYFSRLYGSSYLECFAKYVGLFSFSLLFPVVTLISKIVISILYIKINHYNTSKKWFGSIISLKMIAGGLTIFKLWLVFGSYGWFSGTALYFGIILYCFILRIMLAHFFL